MAAADADVHLVFDCAGLQRGQQLVHIREQEVGGAHQLHVERGVQHVRRRHALMHEARLILPTMFGQVGQEGDDVMFGDGLDLVDAGDVEFDVFGLPHGVGVFARDHAQIGLGVAGMGLDLVPDAEFGLGRPNGDHVGAAVSGDHRGVPFGLRVCSVRLDWSADGNKEHGMRYICTVLVMIAKPAFADRWVKLDGADVSIGRSRGVG